MFMDEDRYLTIKEFCKENSDIVNERKIRHWINVRYPEECKEWIARVGPRIYIKKKKFFEWIDKLSK